MAASVNEKNITKLAPKLMIWPNRKRKKHALEPPPGGGGGAFLYGVAVSMKFLKFIIL